MHASQVFTLSFGTNQHLVLLLHRDTTLSLGDELIIRLKDCELTRHFLGAPKHHSLLEAEAHTVSLVGESTAGNSVSGSLDSGTLPAADDAKHSSSFNSDVPSTSSALPADVVSWGTAALERTLASNNDPTSSDSANEISSSDNSNMPSTSDVLHNDVDGVAQATAAPKSTSIANNSTTSTDSDWSSEDDSAFLWK